MSVNAGINVVFKRRLPKCMEYAGFAVSAPKNKIELEKYSAGS